MNKLNFQITRIGYERCLPDKERIHQISGFNMIHMIESGKGYFNGRQLSAGQGFICRANFRCDYYPDPDDPWTYSYINGSGEDFERLIDMMDIDGGVFTWDHLSDAKRLSIMCKQPFDTFTVSDELALMGAFLKIASDFIKLDEKRNILNYVDRAKLIMQDSHSNGITVGQVADRLNISRAYLRNLFYEQEGVSPQEYLVRLRMSRAAKLLAESYSISEISYAVGYNDSLQFSRAFRRYFGVSPSTYRESLRNSSSQSLRK